MNNPPKPPRNINSVDPAGAGHFTPEAGYDEPPRGGTVFCQDLAGQWWRTDNFYLTEPDWTEATEDEVHRETWRNRVFAAEFPFRMGMRNIENG